MTTAVALGTFEQEVPIPVETNVPPEAKEKSAVHVVKDLLNGPELFHTPDGTAYVSFDHEGRNRTMPIESTYFSQVVRARFFETMDRMIPSRELSEVVHQLAADAVVKGPEIRIHRRVAEYKGGIVLDLADGTGRRVLMTDLDWSVTLLPEVRFVEDARGSALPEPVRGGSLDELKPFLNVVEPDAFFLCVAFLLCTLRPRPPYPILRVDGPQGSSKTTLSKLMKRLVDPGVPEVRSLTNKPEDLLIAAQYSRLIVLDNLSGLPLKTSDTLCSLVTGGGFATRRFFTNGEEAVFEGAVPVIMNGIDGLADRGDLADRGIHIELAPIPSERRRDEESYWEAFRAAHPRILGALCDAVVVALRNLPTVKLPRAPRMADVARWMAAVEPAFGLPAGRMLEIFEANREDALLETAEGDLVVLAVAEFAREQAKRAQYSTALTASQLLDLLNEKGYGTRDTYWPKTPQRLSYRIRRGLPALARLGVNVSFPRVTKSGTRQIIITFSAPTLPPSSSNATSPTAIPRCAAPDAPTDDTHRVPSAGSSARTAKNGLTDATDATDGARV